MSDTRQRPDTDALALFPAESVSPPDAPPIGELIEAADIDDCRFPSESPAAPPVVNTRVAPPEVRQHTAAVVALWPSAMRWVVPSVAALGIGTIAVVWGLRAPQQPSAPEQPAAPVEAPAVTEPAVPAVASAPLAPDTVPSPVGMSVRGLPVVTGVPTSGIQRLGAIQVKPPVLPVARDDVRVARDPLPPIAVLPPPPPDITALAIPTSPAPETAPLATPPEIPAVRAEEDAVRDALADYERAFEQLDVGATSEVWPSVDRRALSRAFATLKSQGLQFDSCDVSIETTMATARCSGTLEFVRKVGNSVPLAQQQHWVFKMRKYGTEWKIQEVNASTQRPRGQS